jgi:hypothetical protein
MGLPIFEAAGVYAGIENADRVSVDEISGTIANLTRSTEFAANPIPPFMQELLDAGGLMPYVLNRKARK